MNVARFLIAFTALASLQHKPAWATAQAGDLLLMDTQTCWIHTNPLGPFLEHQPGFLPPSNIISSGNWRGYIATWEVTGGRLLLRDIEVLSEKPAGRVFTTEYQSVFTDLFPGGAPILADWYSGHIIAPGVELVKYVHQGYASMYSCYHVFTVVRGIVVLERSMDALQFRDFRLAQFRAYQASPAYTRALKEMSAEERSQEESDLFEFAPHTYLSVVSEE